MRDIDALVLVSAQSLTQKYIWNALNSDDRYVLGILNDDMHGMGGLIYKAHMDWRLNRKCELPGKWLWFNRLFSSVPKNVKPKIVLVNEWVKPALSPQFISYLRGLYPGSKLCYRIENPVLLAGKLDGAKTSSYYEYSTKLVEDLYDEVIAFTPEDAEHYGYLYLGEVYSKNPLPPKTYKSSDILFVGKNKGRLEEILAVFEAAKEKGLVCDFHVTGVESKIDRVHSDEIEYNRTMPYGEYLCRLAATKCILEIVAGGGDYISLRPLEAITYKKHLLTNNMTVKESRYSNSQLIHVYDTPDTIDYSFLDERVLTEKMQDAGDFSPINFINKLLEVLEA